ncbi:hypothetical protein QUF72_13870 [Desulfobacterales bacterium HSG2]|nr:hypothetical protein [Desulfobacterales bacterium HSG2]
MKNHLERRCPRLGGPVSFQYCETCGDEELPCFKIFDCWWEYFDVTAYLQEKLAEDQFNKLVHSKPKPKVASLVDLIKQARKIDV